MFSTCLRCDQHTLLPAVEGSHLRCIVSSYEERRGKGGDVSCIMIHLYDADADCDDVETLSQARVGIRL